ncbi:MAG TPA: glycosyltransferase, partial [Gemmatimonadales bacterium]|nr:glycosyltransferase [Gemmatimonadales bacterium]
MRVALFSWAAPTYAGGVERFTSLLARGLTDRGHRVLLYNVSKLADGGRRIGALRPLGVDFPAVGWQLARQFRRDGSPADVVVGDAALLWALRFEPAVAVLHGNGAGHAAAIGGRRGWHLYAQYRWLINSMARRGAAHRQVVAVSEFCARAAARYTGVPAARVIDNAIDTEHFHPAGESGSDRAQLRASFGLPECDFLALFVGRPTYSKGIDLVSAVAARLAPGAG